MRAYRWREHEGSKLSSIDSVFVQKIRTSVPANETTREANMQIIAEPHGIDVPSFSIIDYIDSEAPSIYLMVRRRADLTWFGEDNYEVEVSGLERYLHDHEGHPRRSKGRLYAFWRWPVYDANRIERLINSRFRDRFGSPVIGRRRFLVPDIDTAYQEIAGILDMDGVKPVRRCRSRVPTASAA